MRLLLVDENPHILTGLRALVDGEAPRMSTAGTAHRAADAMGLARRLRPDLVVMDVRAKSYDGFALLARLAREGHPVLVLTYDPDGATEARATKLGAAQVVCKLAPAAELIYAIEGAAGHISEVIVETSRRGGAT